MNRIGEPFYGSELKILYEESAFLYEYFAALIERYHSLKVSYPSEKVFMQDAALKDVRNYLLKKHIQFVEKYYKSNCMYIFTVKVYSVSCGADETIEIVLYKKRVDIHFVLDFEFKKVFKFLHTELALAKRLFLDLRYSIWNDISEEILTIMEKYELVKKKINSVSEKNAQIAANSIKAICKRQLQNEKIEVYPRNYDAVIWSKGKRFRVFYADFLNDPQAFIKSLA